MQEDRQEIQHASGVTGAEVDSGGMAPPPQQGGQQAGGAKPQQGQTKTESAEDLLREQKEHYESGSGQPFTPSGERQPLIGGDKDSPTGVRTNVQTASEQQQQQQQAQEQQQRQRDPEGAADDAISQAYQRYEEGLDRAEAALEKMVAAAAGKGVEDFTPEEVTALQQVQSFMPPLSGATTSAIQHRVTGAAQPPRDGGVLDELIRALSFIRALRNV